MNYLSVTQGSTAWHEVRKSHFTASECAAMLGLSKYQTRTQLLHQKATGEVEEITPSKQALFDKGHRAEDLARPIVEARISQELFPVTITKNIDGLPLLASMDGLTMLGEQGWENKLFNASLATLVENKSIPDTHWPQLEHQMIVSEAESIYFTVSDGTEENTIGCFYESQPERRAQVLNGWKQFEIDLAAYVPTEKVEVAEAEPVRDLPAINYKMNGLALESNLEAYKQAATDLVALSEKPLESDQDFANAEARQKVFTKAEKDIKGACDRVMGEIDSIDTFVKDMRFISEQIRQARLAEGKQIKARKEEIRQEILSKATVELLQAGKAAEEKVNAPLPSVGADVYEAMKGKRTIESLQDAADTEVARAKITITEFVEVAQANMLVIADNREFDFLFNDWAQIAFKANDDFKALVTARIATYKDEQKVKEDEQRERIRQEEQAKIQRESEAKAKAEQEAAEQAKREEQAKRDAEEKARLDVEDHETNEPKEEVKPEPEAKPTQYMGKPSATKPEITRQFGLMELNAMDQLAKLVEQANKPYASDLREFVESVKANNLKKVA